MNVQVTVDGVLAYDSRLPDEKGYGMESIRVYDALNKGGSATLILPPQHPLRDAFTAFRSEVVIYRDGKLRWRGRPLPGSRDKYNRRTITCEGELCFLQDATLRPCSLSGDPATIFAEIINGYNATVEPWKRFAVGVVTVASDTDVTFDVPNPQLVYAAVQSLIKTHGGYILFDTLPDGKRRINWYADLPYPCNQRIKWGVNLTDYSASTDTSDFATRIVPYGAMLQDGRRVTINVDGKDYVENAEAIAQRGVIEVPKIYNDIKSPAELQAAAQRDVDRAGTLPETIRLSALDMSRQDASLDAFRIGQRINADSTPHHLSGIYALASMEEDLLDSSVGQITLTREAAYSDSTGSTLTGAISGDDTKAQTERKFTSYLNTVASMMATILGANGGAVRMIDTDGDNMPDTLYIADNPDPEQAVKVWRFNYEGWAGSKTGYNGQFVAAATLEDGLIAAALTSQKDQQVLRVDGGQLQFLLDGKKLVDLTTDIHGIAWLSLYHYYKPTGEMMCYGGFSAQSVSVYGTKEFYGAENGASLYIDTNGESHAEANHGDFGTINGMNVYWADNGDGTYTFKGTA